MTPAGLDAKVDRDAAKGMAMMCGATLIIPGLDAIAKLLGETLSPFQVGFMRYVLQTMILTGLMVLLGRKIFIPAVVKALPRLVLAGGLMGLAVSMLFWGLQHLPLANAIAIFFVGPLIVTLFSKVLLKEQVGWHRTSAVLVGLIGALVVIRPNWEAFGWYAVLPLLSATSFAGVMITVRSISAALDGIRIQTVSGGCASVFLGLAVVAGELFDLPLMRFNAPTSAQLPLIFGLGVVATAAQMLMTGAIKHAQASLLAPFQYIEIIGATFYGVVLFGEFPDTVTWIGTAIILSSGLYVIHCERTLAKARRATIALS